jgi:ElaB/YqjD/DUF883 family membrane-anchored ribosome-binding protein
MYVAGTVYASEAGYSETGYDTAGSDTDGGGVKEKLGAAGDKLRDAKDSAADSVRGAKDSAMNSMRSGAHRVSEGSHRAADRARRESRRAREGFQTMLEEQPFVIGALGIALGAVIGALLPESEREDRMLGQARDRVLDRAKDLGARGYEQVRGKAEQAAAGAKDAVQGSGGSRDPGTSPGGMPSGSAVGSKEGGADVGSAGVSLRTDGSPGSTGP